jgi:hypothetical protein
MLLTNFPPRGWLSYEKLREQRSDLIQLTIQGDRHGGSAVDYTINPRIGLPFLTGNGDANEAVNHVLPACDLVTGQMAAPSSTITSSLVPPTSTPMHAPGRVIKAAQCVRSTTPARRP